MTKDNLLSRISIDPTICLSCHAFQLGIRSEQDTRTTRMRAIIDIKV